MARMAPPVPSVRPPRMVAPVISTRAPRTSSARSMPSASMTWPAPSIVRSAAATSRSPDALASSVAAAARARTGSTSSVMVSPEVGALGGVFVSSTAARRVHPPPAVVQFPSPGTRSGASAASSTTRWRPRSVSTAPTSHPAPTGRSVPSWSMPSQVGSPAGTRSMATEVAGGTCTGTRSVVAGPRSGSATARSRRPVRAHDPSPPRLAPALVIVAVGAQSAPLACDAMIEARTCALPVPATPAVSLAVMVLRSIPRLPSTSTPPPPLPVTVEVTR